MQAGGRPMKLLCTKTVIMEDGNQAFTKGKQYKARKHTVTFINGDPYEFEQVLRAKNDNGEQHIIKHLERDDNNFFYIHFKELS